MTVLSRTRDKAEDARALGAADLLATTDDAEPAKATGRFDLVLDAIPAPHDLAPLLRLLALDGTLSVVGYPREVQLQLMHLTYGRKNLSSSGTGGTKHTAELLEFAAGHGITADVEVLPSSRVDEALARLQKGDVRYRFVLDLSDLDD
ncbi:zinc-binding dehydrogenase [Dactylosporangium sp. CS-047395]|uniref:zinc-binding dehydrogenase n=1 Tax=Dactylosporangium sp. CS-047395 TaxID=3239936 RepID=UPI003D918912